MAYYRQGLLIPRRLWRAQAENETGGALVHTTSTVLHEAGDKTVASSWDAGADFPREIGQEQRARRRRRAIRNWKGRSRPANDKPPEKFPDCLEEDI